MQKSEITKSTTARQHKPEQEQSFFAPASAFESQGQGHAEKASFFKPGTKPVIQPKLTINEPDDPYEREADAMAEQVMRMTVAGAGEEEETIQTKPTTLATVQRDEKTDAPESTDDASESPSIGFGSAALPWWVLKDIFSEFPDRWSSAYKGHRTSGYPLLSADISPELAAAQMMALQHLMWAGIFSGNGKYPGMGFGKGLEMAQYLTDDKDTFLSLASIPLRFDVKEYLGGKFADRAKANLGWALLYGLPLQGGLTGINAATDSKLNFASLLSPALSPFTAAPSAMGRPFGYKNIPDPRWGSYLFNKIPGDLTAEVDNYQNEKPNQLSLGMGLNIGSFFADNYPKEKSDQEKYRGPELYPFGFYKHQWAAEGDDPATRPHAWMAGLYGGYGGFGGLFAAGRQSGTEEENYYRAMFTMNRFNWWPLLQLGGELSDREGGLRARLEAAAKFNILDLPNWELSAGARLSGLLPGAGQPGAFEGGGELGFYYKHLLEGDQSALKTGLKFGMMDRLEDPFDAQSARLRSMKGSLSIMDFLQFSLESHQVRGGMPDPAANLPGSDLRFMIYLGSGGFRMNAANQADPGIQRKCTDCEEEEMLQTKSLMRKAEGGGYTASNQLSTQLGKSKGSGNRLSGNTLSSMNSAFGADFSSVRIHVGQQAAEMSEGIRARAFTHGSDIYFNQGQFQPETSSGKRLLAHELTHVVQQGKSNPAQPTIRRKAITSLGSIPEVERRQIQYSTVAVPDTLKSQLNGLFATDPAKAGGATVSFPFSGTVHFDTTIPATSSVEGYDVRKGLSNVAGWLINQTNILPQNHTISVLLDITAYGGDNAIYRFTRFDLGTGDKATNNLLIEKQHAAQIAAPAATKPAAGTDFKIGGQTFKLGSGWSQAEFNILSQALGLLNTNMLKKAAGITFKRSATNPNDPEAGHYDSSDHSITIRDNAFRKNMASYGQYQEGVRIIVHEIGHALDYFTLNEAWQQYQSTGKESKLKVTSDSGLTYKENPQTKDFEIVEGAKSNDFRKAVLADRGNAGGRTMPDSITTYGQTNWEESFAEAYSYYMTDRSTFKLLRPKTAAYFDKAFK